MTTAIPVLEDMNGYFIINIYEAGSDGVFKRSGKRPFRLFNGLIAGASSPMGTIECNPRSRFALEWRSPTVTSYLERRPQSVYHFFRENLKKRKYYIATAKDGMSRTRILYLHELQFKSSTSLGVKRMFAEKFSIATDIWGVSKKLAP